MPIIIRKGSDHQNKKHISKHNSKNHDDISDDEKDYKHIEATDMTDILDFKIYRIKKPTFYDSSAKTTLIGEMFYNDEIDETLNSNKKTKTLNNLDPKTETIDKNDVLVERIEDSNKVRIKSHPKVVLQRVNKFAQTFKSLKSSAVLNYSYDPPTLGDTLQWAFMYIEWNESNLITNFIEFENNLKKFQEEKISSKSRKDKTRGSMEFKISSDNSIQRTEKSQLPHYHSNTSNNYSVNNNTISSTNERLKSKSLSVQLEALKTQGVDSFLRNIETFHKRPSFMNITASKKHPITLPFVLEQSQPDTVHQATLNQINSTGLHHELIKSQQQQQQQQQVLPTKPSSSKPTSSGSNSRRGSLLANTISREVSRDDISLISAATFSGREHTVHAGSRRTSFAIPLSTYPSKDTFPRDSDLFTSLLTTSNNKDETFENLSSSNTKNNSNRITPSNHNNKNNSNKKKIMKPSHNNSYHTIARSNHNKVSPQHSVINNNPSIKQYSNKTIVSAQPTNNNIMSTQMTAETQQTIQEIRETQERFKKTMGHILKQISNYKNKTDSMQNQITDQISKLEQKTIHVIKDINKFSINHDNLYNITNGKLNEKEFLRNTNIKEKINCLDLFFTQNYNLNENVHRDFKIISKNTKRNVYKSTYMNLIKHKWFIMIVTKLREYIKKTNLIPLCCVKYIIVLKYVLMFGYNFDKDLFYIILEKTIILHEDHLKAIVHSFLKGLRETIDIDPLEYYNYLESKNIPANPELLNQVRMFKEQHVLMNSRMYFKKPGSSNNNNYSNISNNSKISSSMIVKLSTDEIAATSNLLNNNISTQELDINNNNIIPSKQHGGLLAIVIEDL